MLNLLRDYSPADDGVRPGMEAPVQAQLFCRHAQGKRGTADKDGV